MRQPFVAGNWKMNKTVAQAEALITEMLPGLEAAQKGVLCPPFPITAENPSGLGVECVLCPPFPALMAASKLLQGKTVCLGAQNLHWEASGAYTGEVSPAMIKEFCQYVILGHSERRTYFGETDETVNKKIKAALAVGLIPIVCIGETLQENQAGKTHEVVERQVRLGLAGLTPEQAQSIVIAYEPVWAIGTGLAATSDVAEKVHKEYIRTPLADMFGAQVSESMRILYGGSVTAANAVEFFGQPDVDGALVGGASLKPADFVKIVEAARK